jgi:CubicO group peptidase (beta-lactamase class C family)
MDDRLERRLRDNPTGDRRHIPAHFEDRFASAVAVRPLRRGDVRRELSLGFVTVGVAAILVLGVLRWGVLEPGDANPSPSVTAPTASVPADADPAALRAVVLAWAERHGLPSGSVSIVDRRGVSLTIGLGTFATADEAAVGRIGEASRLYVAAGVLVLLDCSRENQTGCSLPVDTGAVEIDDPIARWFPTSRVADRTVRQLLQGSSGIAAIGPTIEELAARIDADPEAAWDRASVLDVAMAAPLRFEAGARREPVDTEALLLEEIIRRATGRDPGVWIEVTSYGHAGLRRTWIGDVAEIPLMPGQAGGDTVADLDVTLLELLGASGGIAADSDDLARFAAFEWGTTVTQSAEALALVTDAEGGHRAPLGAIGYCPCAGGARSVIALTGHAIGWSSLAGYDLDRNTGIGVVVDEDFAQPGLEELLADLITVIRA